jgi:hypothetical protein
VSSAFDLDAGLYNVVPCIFDPKTSGNFKLTTSTGTLTDLEAKNELRDTEFEVMISLNKNLRQLHYAIPICNIEITLVL